MKKFKNFRDNDGSEDLYEQRSDRQRRLKEKRMRSAMKQRNIDRLLDIEDDYL